MLAVCGLLAIGALLGACGGGDSKSLATPKTGESAGDAVTRQLNLLSNKQFGPEWDELHPAQQALIPRDAYIQCGAKGNLPAISDVSVTTTYNEAVTIPGTQQKADSTAVTVKLTARLGAQTQQLTQTFHEFVVDGHWRWTVADPSLYANGKCP